MKIFQRKTAIALGGNLLFSSLSLGAVYNLYFNNTEQGNNSTAQPSVTIQSPNGSTQPLPEKAPENPLQTTPTQAAPETAIAPLAPEDSNSESQSPAPQATESTPAIVPAPAQGAVARVYYSGTQQSSDRNWHARFGIGAAQNSHYGDIGPGFNTSLHYSALPYMNFGILFGTNPEGADEIYAAAELELIPVKVNLFGFKDVIELGVLAGTTTLAAAPGNLVSLHTGGRVGWNFGDRWSVNATARLNKGFVSSDLSLGIRF
jgi:hypothetical protein